MLVYYYKGVGIKANLFQAAPILQSNSCSNSVGIEANSFSFPLPTLGGGGGLGGTGRTSDLISFGTVLGVLGSLSLAVPRGETNPVQV